MIDKIINELHVYEKKFLKGIEKDGDLSPEEIAQEEDMPVKAVTSAAGMLESKDIITVDKKSIDTISLSDEGKEYAMHGLPEHKILKALQDFSKRRM
jgi:phenylalanyl-tRNA synthetase alpha chain